MDIIARVLEFWFAESEGYRDAWFKSDSAFDGEIQIRFEDDVKHAADGELDRFGHTPKGALALIILLDQFPRNLYRGSAGAFAADGKALALAEVAVDAEFHIGQPNWKSMFYFLPFEHSESLADQERSVALFREFGDENTLKYAIEHRDIIARFGRFPHRNKVLGRTSTREEREFLETFDAF